MDFFDYFVFEGDICSSKSLAARLKHDGSELDPLTKADGTLANICRYTLNLLRDEVSEEKRVVDFHSGHDGCVVTIYGEPATTFKRVGVDDSRKDDDLVKTTVRSCAEFRFAVDGGAYSGAVALVPHGREIRVNRKTPVHTEAERIVEYLANPDKGYKKGSPTTKIGEPIKKSKTSAKISGAMRRQMNDDPSGWQ